MSTKQANISSKSSFAIMIETDAEYGIALKRLEKDGETIEKQKEKFEGMKLSPEELDRAMQPLLSFHEQLKEEVEAYEQIKGS